MWFTISYFTESLYERALRIIFCQQRGFVIGEIPLRSQLLREKENTFVCMRE